MIDKLATAFAENLWTIIAVICAIGFYAFLQAGISMLRDWFLVKVFHKKLNSGSKNGKLMEAQLNRLIELSTERNEKLDCVTGMAKQVDGMHEAIMTKDNNGTPRITNMFRYIHNTYTKVVKGG